MVYKFAMKLMLYPLWAMNNNIKHLSICDVTTHIYTSTVIWVELIDQRLEFTARHFAAFKLIRFAVIFSHIYRQKLSPFVCVLILATNWMWLQLLGFELYSATTTTMVESIYQFTERHVCESVSVCAVARINRKWCVVSVCRCVFLFFSYRLREFAVIFFPLSHKCIFVHSLDFNSSFSEFRLLECWERKWEREREEMIIFFVMPHATYFNVTC